MRQSFLFLVACGGAAPVPAAAVHVEPVPIAVVDAGPKCVQASDEAPPKWMGTYPKIFPLLTGDAAAEKQKALVARNPGVEGFYLDERGLVYGFDTAKLPYAEAQMTNAFLTGRDVLADAQPILEELRCQGPDIAGFVPVNAHIAKAAHHVLVFERKRIFDDLARDEPLPPQLDDAVLADKWKIGVEVARVHDVVVHFPAQRCVGSSRQPCDPVGPRDETIEKRVPVGTMQVPKKYSKVTVARGTYRRATGFELRLVARVDVRWPELQSEVITPRFGVALQPQLTGNFQELFDAVTGDSFNPIAP